MALYRIVRDSFQGYEVQRRPRWWPFWHQVDHVRGVNTFATKEAAEAFARRYASRPGHVVAYLGELPSTSENGGGG